MDSNTLKQTRYHGLDALRGFAMILGNFHSSNNRDDYI